MIARHLPIKNNYKSSAQGLVSYLMNTQENSHRVLDFSITNCLGITSDDEEAITAEEVHLAAREMIAVQCMNSSAKSAKMYHLLVSFKDDPDKATLHNIEQELCEALGFKDFQRVSVLHGDTDNAHLHIAINKIHPATYNIHNPYRDHTVLAHMCEKLEKKYGIQVDNHEFKTEARPSRATAMEKAGDMESLIGWMQRNCKETLKNAGSWEEFHKVLASRNLKIQERGNGFIFTDGKVHVKASSVDRAFSKPKLEARLGKFEAIEKQVPVLKEYKLKPMNHGFRTDRLYEKYQQDRRDAANNRKKELNELFLQEKAEIKNLFDRTVGDQVTRMIRHSFWRKVLRFIKHQEQMAKLKAIKERHTRAEAEIIKKYERLSWKKWLENEAKNGNQAALKAMQSRGLIRPTKNMIQTDRSLTSSRDAVKVTRKGSRLFSDGTKENRGRWMFKPTKEIENSQLKGQIRAFFIKNPDNELHVTGEQAFVDTVLDVARELRITPRFDQPELSRRLKDSQYPLNHKNEYRGR